MASLSLAGALAMLAGAAASVIHAQEPPAVIQKQPSSSSLVLSPPAAIFPLAISPLAVRSAEERQAASQQQQTPSQQPTAAPEQAPNAPFPEEAMKNATSPCVEPPPMVRIQDYDGPLKKVVGTFARPLERKSVHPPHYKAGAKLCTLSVKGKFLLFVQDSVDPVTFLGAGFDAGLDQAEDSDDSYGQGAEGYGRRFAAELAGEATSRFFGDFLYPSIFSEDPRYYRLAQGSTKKRLVHALEHVFVAHNDNGKRMFNFSEWLGTTSSVVLSNTFHPDHQRGFSATAQSVSYSILQDAGYDVLREFWPEISRKLKLPFRGQSDPASQDAIAASK